MIERSNDQIKIGAIISYVAIIFNILAGLIYTPWMVKQIGKSDYGLYTLAISVINLFLLDFGISGSISRFISIYRSQGDEEKVHDLLGLIYKLYLIIDSIIFIILVIIYILIKDIFVQLNPTELERFRIIYSIVGFYSLISFPFMSLNGILISYEKFVPLKTYELIQKIISIVLVIVALVCGYGLISIVLINTFVGMGVVLLKYRYIKNKLNIKSNFKFYDPTLLRKLLFFSVWITVISVSQRLIINITPSILGVFSGAIQISIFSIGNSLEGYIWTFANAFNGLFLSKVTRIVTKENDVNLVTELMIKVGRIQLEVIGILLIGIFFMGKEFIFLWMGKDFINSYYVSLFLILPGYITLTQEIAYNYLVALGEVKYRAYDYICTAVISILFSFVLTPKYGAIGAALAAFIGILLGHVLIMNLIYYKIFKIDIPRFLKECHFKLLLPFLFTSLVAIFIQLFFPVDRLLYFFIKTIIVSLFYIAFMWLLGLNSFEKKIYLGFHYSIKKRIFKT